MFKPGKAVATLEGRRFSASCDILVLACGAKRTRNHPPEKRAVVVVTLDDGGSASSP